MKAVDDYVRSGMVVGLGTGSTAYFAVERVGEKVLTKSLWGLLTFTSLDTLAKFYSLCSNHFPYSDSLILITITPINSLSHMHT